MEVIERTKKERKQIVFNVSAEDHETIKKIAAEKGIPMRVWIINAMAEQIKRDMKG